MGQTSSLAASRPTAAPMRSGRPVRLRALMYEAGLNRAGLARAIGTSVQTACRAFDGTRDLSLPEAVRLAAELSSRLGRPVAVNDLLDGEM